MVGALRGAGDTVWVMLTSVCMQWINIGLLYVLFHYMHVSPQIGWIVVALSFMPFCLVFGLRYRGGKWRTIDMIGDVSVAV
jgi:MATE family multidrug resistance protein